MTKKDAGRPKGPGRPPKGRLKVTLRLSPGIVDALSKAHEKTGRDKSDLAEEALAAYLHLGDGRSKTTKS
jgi:predicted transcriptional regulator